jgi:hypothetical protein
MDEGSVWILSHRQLLQLPGILKDVAGASDFLPDAVIMA